MTPYYQDDLVTLYHGDSTVYDSWFQERMPEVDVVVTDPPYDLAGNEAAAKLVAKWRHVAVFGWPENLVRIAMAAGRVPDDWLVWWPTNAGMRSWGPKGQTPRESEHIAIWGDVRWVHGAPRSENAAKIGVVADRIKSPNRRGDTSLSPLGKRYGDVWTDPSPGLGFQSHLRLHPNEKPLTVMTRLLEVVFDGCVLDPFAGSGTTLVAAKMLGRKAIGVEKSEAHCQTAATRLSQEILGLSARPLATPPRKRRS